MHEYPSLPPDDEPRRKRDFFEEADIEYEDARCRESEVEDAE